MGVWEFVSALCFPWQLQMLVALSEVILGEVISPGPQPSFGLGEAGFGFPVLWSECPSECPSLPDTAWHTGQTLSSSSHVTGSLQLFVPGLIHAGGQHRCIFK